MANYCFIHGALLSLAFTLKMPSEFTVVAMTTCQNKRMSPLREGQWSGGLVSGFGPNKQTEDDKHLVGKVSRASATTKKNSFYIQLVGNLVTFHRVSYSK